MDKIGMRDWVCNVEKFVDEKLKKWQKQNNIENGEALQMGWRFEQHYIVINVFWNDKKEHVHFQFIGPRVSSRWEWDGLNDRTRNKIIDRAGNLAQIVLHPPDEYRNE